MLGQLIESRRAKRPLGVGFLSLCLHLGLGIGVVKATTGIPATSPTREFDNPIALPPETAEPILEPARPDPILPTVPGAPVLVMTPPTEIPTTIPPVELGPPVDPKRFSGLTGLAAGCPPACAVSAKPIGSAVFKAEEIDAPARVVSQPTPRFPPVLQAAGIAGRVTLDFIVDTTGHVEPRSVRVLESSHAGFEPNASEVVLRSVFVPGRVKGRPVRQMMRQAISYRINAP